MRLHNPELLSLSRIEWQFFCTFTFKSERLTDAIRLSIFFAMLRTQARNFGVHFKHLVWGLRRESGESTGRLHFHALIAGLPPSGRTVPTCFATMRLWERLGGGFAKVTVYNPTLDGVDYRSSEPCARLFTVSSFLSRVFCVHFSLRLAPPCRFLEQKRLTFNIVEHHPSLQHQTVMAIPIGLATVAGRLRSGRTGIGIRGASSPQRPRTFLSPLSKVIEYSERYVEALPTRRRKAHHAES